MGDKIGYMERQTINATVISMLPTANRISASLFQRSFVCLNPFTKRTSIVVSLISRDLISAVLEFQNGTQLYSFPRRERNSW